MIFYVRKAMIELCNKVTMEEFFSTYTVADVCKLMSLPLAEPATIYKHLQRTLVRDLSNWIKLDFASSSKGNQIKYYSESEKAYIKLQFFYEDQYWHDELVEVISSDLFHDKFDIPVLEQFPVLTNKGWGTYSKDFANDSSFISFATLCNKEFGAILMTPQVDRFIEIRDRVSYATGLDMTNYLLVMALTDAIVLNEDRHLNNFGVLYKNGQYSLAPLFDYGLGLFEHDACYNTFKRNDNLEVALRKVKSKPFLSNHFKTLKKLCALGYGEKLQSYFERIDIPDDLYTPSSLSGMYMRSVLERIRSIIYV